MKFLLTPVMLLAATTAFANNDSLLNAPVKIKLFPESGKVATSEEASLLAELNQEGKSWWVEISAGLTIDWLSPDDNYITDTSSYASMFETGLGVEFQIALNHVWGPKTDWFQYSFMLRPYLGFSAHLFEGDEHLGNAVSDLMVTTLHGGLMFGAGNMPDGSGPGIFVYLNVQAGMALMQGVEMTRAGATFDLTDDTQDIYYALGVGARLMLGGLTFNFEAGTRNYGRPENDNAANPVLTSEDPMVTWYLLFGVTLDF